MNDWMLSNGTEQFREEERRHRNRDDEQPSLFDPPRGDCPLCDGTGRVDHAPFNDPQYGITLQPWTVCPNCGGSGSPQVPF